MRLKSKRKKAKTKKTEVIIREISTKSRGWFPSLFFSRIERIKTLSNRVGILIELAPKAPIKTNSFLSSFSKQITESGIEKLSVQFIILQIDYQTFASKATTNVKVQKIEF